MADNNEEEQYFLFEFTAPPSSWTWFSDKRRVIIKAKDRYEASKKFHKDPERRCNCTITNIYCVPFEQ